MLILLSWHSIDRTEVTDIDTENVTAAATVTAATPSEAQQALATFWPRVTEEIRKTGLVCKAKMNFLFKKRKKKFISV